MIDQNVCLKDRMLQDFRRQTRSKNCPFLIDRLFEEARQSFLQGGSPAAVGVINDTNALGRAGLSEVFGAATLLLLKAPETSGNPPPSELIVYFETDSELRKPSSFLNVIYSTF